MAVSIGRVSGSSWVQNSFLNKGKRKNRVVCSAAFSATSLTDEYKTLRIKPDASEKDVKKAFRQLALQYHPDVCKGSNCGVQFCRINEAYNIVMSNLSKSTNSEDGYSHEYSVDGYDVEPMRGMYDDDSSELWEEWMGWEGAGIRDYSSHINPDV